MCRLLGVTRSGYYGYQQRQSTRPPDFYHQEMIEAVKDIAKASDDSYGSRRMKKALNVLSYPVSRNKARQLMKEAGVAVKYRKKYKVTTNSNHKQPILRMFSIGSLMLTSQTRLTLVTSPTCGHRKAGSI